MQCAVRSQRVCYRAYLYYIIVMVFVNFARETHASPRWWVLVAVRRGGGCCSSHDIKLTKAAVRPIYNVMLYWSCDKPDHIFQIILLCFVALTVADRNARIVNYQSGIEEDGSYQTE